MANQNKKTSLYVLAESAIMVALATVLSMVKVYEAPYGGSVTLLSMAPIIILSMRRGVKTGLLAGFVQNVVLCLAVGSLLILGFLFLMKRRQANL